MASSAVSGRRWPVSDSPTSTECTLSPLGEDALQGDGRMGTGQGGTGDIRGQGAGKRSFRCRLRGTTPGKTTGGRAYPFCPADGRQEGEGEHTASSPFKGNQVAVKRVPPHADKVAKQEFISEVNFMKKLGYHSHILG